MFNVTFVAQKEFVERFREDGLRQVYWLPLACAPEIYPSVDLDRCNDVTYVGSNNSLVHPVRHTLLSAIRKEFPSAVLLSDQSLNNSVEELFILGKHFLKFREEQVLLDLIRSLLRDPERYRHCGHSASRHVLDNHSYRHRADRLLDFERHSFKQTAPRPKDYFSAFFSLNLFFDVADCVARAAAFKSGGVYEKPTERVAALLLGGLARVVSAFDRARGIFSAYLSCFKVSSSLRRPCGWAC